MTIRMTLSAAVAALLLNCSNPCEISEKYSISTSHFVYDKGYNKYPFKFTFVQEVEVWSGDCAAEKSKNKTYLSMTSYAPCDQTVNFTVDVKQGAFSYQIKKNNVAVKTQETIDFGLVYEGGGRIDGAYVDIALFCPLCPQDQP